MIVQADAAALPFVPDTFDVVVADPPYKGRMRGKRALAGRTSGYIPYRDDRWFAEAWRVLRPGGSLYVFCAIRELARWLGRRAPHDVICWYAPNATAVASYWLRGITGRAPAWRPIVHYIKPPVSRDAWRWGERATNGARDPRHAEATFSALRQATREGWVDPNFYSTSAIQSTMREAEAWPNQLPVALLRWLLRPHRQSRVLDLFAGSGTTRVAAETWGITTVSVDLSPEALAINAARPAQRGLAALG